jgi:hypothetical protein
LINRIALSQGSALSGAYFYHQRPGAPNPIPTDLRTQEELLAECRRISGIE